MSIQIIIPFQHSTNLDEELRYALRSLDKHITGVGEVIIIGDKPLWPHQNLTVLECKNVYGTDNMRDANIYHKMKLGFEYIKAERAIVMHDDNFFLMYSEAGDWPWYYGDWPVLGGGLYKDVVENTRNKCTKYFDVHCAHIITKSWMEVGNMFDWSRPPGWCIKTMLIDGAGGIEGQYITDLNLRAYYSPEEIKEMIHGRPWLSAADNGFRGGGLRSVIKELYPDPSRYEA